MRYVTQVQNSSLFFFFVFTFSIFIFFLLALCDSTDPVGWYGVGAGKKRGAWIKEVTRGSYILLSFATMVGERGLSLFSKNPVYFLLGWKTSDKVIYSLMLLMFFFSSIRCVFFSRVAVYPERHGEVKLRFRLGLRLMVKKVWSFMSIFYEHFF